MPMKQKVALITGVTGQDGAYLAKFLLDKGYQVHGIRRRASMFNTGRIEHLVHDPHEPGPRFELHYADLTDSTSLIRVIEQVQPDELYNLAAQSHVAVSFEEPEYTGNTDALGAVRAGARDTSARNDPVLPAQSLRSCQAIRPLDHGQLSRSIRLVRLQRDLVQPRIAVARRNLRYAQDHARARPDPPRDAAMPAPWKPGGPAGLGACGRLRRGAMADAAAGAARRLRDRHRSESQRARIRRCGDRAARHPARLGGSGRRAGRPGRVVHPRRGAAAGARQGDRTRRSTLPAAK